MLILLDSDGASLEEEEVVLDPAEFCLGGAIIDFLLFGDEIFVDITAAAEPDLVKLAGRGAGVVEAEKKEGEGAGEGDTFPLAG